MWERSCIANGPCRDSQHPGRTLGLISRPDPAGWGLRGDAGSFTGGLFWYIQAEVLAHSRGKKNKRGEIAANATETVTKTKCLGENKKRKTGAKPTATSAPAVTEQTLDSLGFCLETAQLLTDVLCVLSLGRKEMSRYNWEKYDFNIPFLSSSLLHIFHYASLWLLTVKYK